ncbi:hypothetical protein PMZ80_010447 [Knufia obscura]|uniref:Sulfotransferase n=1 Tax=Knufia obscura TaxID=1635080 RepID=A0ABR0RA04_9EURO|nr:hypothetical protein PMZ80_010447 [Knufia obscura]
MATAEDYERLGAWAVILNPDLNIDRRQCTRQVPMQVLSLGAPRTATLSMKEAYETLGLPCYHYASIFANCRDADMWNDALDAKFKPGSGKQFGKKEFDQLLGHCAAVTDVPSVIFLRELLEAYPDVKVVLVDREQEKWLTSMRTLIGGILSPVNQYVVKNVDSKRTGRILHLADKWISCWFGIEGKLTVDKVLERAPELYKTHYESIRAAVPRERLLEYKLGSGWEPLCEFLGKDVPGVAFPHRNDAETLDRAFGQLVKTGLKSAGKGLGMAGVVVAVVGVLWQVYGRG